MLAVAPFIGFIPVLDLAAARRFYEDRVGLVIAEETPFALVVDVGAAAAGGSANNNAMLRLTLVPELRPQPFTIAGWAVPDIDREITRLTGQGIAMRRYEGIDQTALGVWDAPGGDRVAWFQDPDGNVLSLTQFAGMAGEDADEWSAGWSAPPPPPLPTPDDEF